MVQCRFKKSSLKVIALSFVISTGSQYGLTEPADLAQNTSCAVATHTARDLLENYCVSCHGNIPVNNGLADILDVNNLTKRGYLSPGSAESSYIYQRLASGTMPPASAIPRPDPREVSVMRDWIECGAPEFGEVTASTSYVFVDRNSRLEEIYDDLSKFRPTERESYRYISFYSLANIGLSENQIERYRQATIYLLNSVSRSARVVDGHSSWVGKNRLLYRLDSRELGWDFDTFDKVSEHYPYDVRFDSNSPLFNIDESIAEIIRDMTGSAIFELNADWLLANLSQSPLYETVLDLPRDLRSLEWMLDVDIESSLWNLESRRFGVRQSGVSGAHRVVEFIQRPAGLGLWLSYDFVNNDYGNSPFNYPLSFDADSHEVMFSLNNGFFAYSIYDADGNFVPVAPMNIVQDPNAYDGQVTNARSCLACHSKGLISRNDEVREHVLSPDQFLHPRMEEILEVYASNDEVRALIDGENRKFREALTRAGIHEVDEKILHQINEAFHLSITLDGLAATLGIQTDTLRFAIDRNFEHLPARIVALAFAKSATIDRKFIDDNFAEIVAGLELGRLQQAP